MLGMDFVTLKLRDPQGGHRHVGSMAVRPCSVLAVRVGGVDVDMGLRRAWCSVYVAQGPVLDVVGTVDEVVAELERPNHPAGRDVETA